MVLKAFSFGGGVQSTAALVLASQGKLDYRTFLFCNVGEDSENPETLTYVHEIAMPFAVQHGLDLIELRKVRRDGTVDTIYQTMTRPESRSIGIPVHMSNGAPGRRACTLDFKIRVADRWVKQQLRVKEPSVGHVLLAGILQQEFGVPVRETLQEFEIPDGVQAMVGLGISFDERLRVRYPLIDEETPWKMRDYPLVDEKIDRLQCMNIIRAVGLPVPPKSSCWFCPYHSQRNWQALREHQPVLFERAVALERLINERRAMIGKDQVFLSRKCKPLPMATTEYVQSSFLEEEDLCESGYCFV
ncbi:MAG TPA: hypothetical protein VJ761_07995 [Ktedonobacteraceae bacterium]|nr:hypothetical protein [Ktedonobacteraceae bacterium]